MKKYLCIFLFLLISFFECACNTSSGIISYVSKDSAETDVSAGNAKTSNAQGKSESERLYVAILGEVMNPGVYVFAPETRVYEAINAAGGVTARGDISGVDLVDIIQNDQQIVVPMAAGLISDSQDNQSTLTVGTSGLVNINTAPDTALMTLAGIGPSKAAAIIAYRNENGAFTSTEDIMLVPGIKEGTYSKIKDLITIK